MISALIQSEAAIFGIVITLSLVAVQQSANSFSPRVTEIFTNFKKNPDFYVLILIYLGGMLYSTLILKIIKDGLKDEIINLTLSEHVYTIGNIVSISFVETTHSFDIQMYIWSTFFLACFAFFALIIYIKRTMNLLNPLNIIEILSENITSENLAEYLVKSTGYKILLEPSRSKIITHIKYNIAMLSYLLGITNYGKKDEDPLLPLVDIIRGSLIRYDYETSTKALKTLEDKIVTLIKEENFDTLEYCKYAPKDVDYTKISVGATNFKEYQHYLIKKIYKNIFNHFERMGQLAINHRDYYSSMEIITVIEHLIKAILDKDNINNQVEATIQEGLFSLQGIGITASKQNMEYVVIEVWTLIQHFGKICASKKLNATALKTYDMVIKLRPNIVDSWIYKGEISILLGDRTKAMDSFEKANTIKKTSKAYYNLSKIYEKVGYDDKALDALAEAHFIDEDEEFEARYADMINNL